MRVYEIARALHWDSRTTMALLADVGIVTRSPSSLVEPVCADTFIRGWRVS